MRSTELYDKIQYLYVYAHARKYICKKAMMMLLSLIRVHMQRNCCQHLYIGVVWLKHFPMNSMRIIPIEKTVLAIKITQIHQWFRLLTYIFMVNLIWCFTHIQHSIFCMSLIFFIICTTANWKWTFDQCQTDRILNFGLYVIKLLMGF